MRRLRRAAVAGIAVLSLMIGACGVRDDPGPQALDDAALPPEEVVEVPERDEALTIIPVYFISQEHLVTIERPGSGPVTLAGAMRLLLRGPSNAEAAMGVRTAIPAATELLGTSSAGRTAFVDLRQAFTAVVGSEQILALAQVVYTATSVEGIDLVRFAIDGEDIEVPRADGSLSTGAVGRSDFASLAPP